MHSNRSRGTLMSYGDHSAQRRFKSNAPNVLVPLVKSAADFMGGTKIWQDFYSLAPGLPTSDCFIMYYNTEVQIIATICNK